MTKVTDSQIIKFTVSQFSAEAPILGAPATSPEGTTINLTTAIDTDVEYGWSVSRDGEGFALGLGTIFSFTPTDNGVYQVTLTASRSSVPVGTSSTIIVVQNVAPTADFMAPASAVNEGSSFSLSLENADDASDDDTAAGFTYAFDCGGGSGFGAFSASHSTSCATTDDGLRTVRAKIRDKDGGVHEYPESGFVAVVIIDNVAPTVTAPANQNALEGTAEQLNLGSFTDPGADGPWQVTIAWGDGATSTFAVATAGSIGLQSHIFAEDATYSVQITVDDHDSGVHSAMFDVVVARVDRTLAISGPASINEGRPYRLTLSSTDPGADTITNWTINWGDGKIESLTDDPSSATHVYIDGPNTYSISASATDEDGSYVSSNRTVTVNNVAPTLTITGAATTNEGTNYVLSLSSSDPGTDTISGWTITWGDGSVEAVTGNPSSVSHLFADGAAGYTISATATDGDGTFAANSIAVAVKNVAPTLTIGGAATVNEGASYSLNLSSSDPGTDTITSWTIIWGDGLVQNVSGNPSSVSHTFADGANNYTVSATATDEDGSFAANTVALTVNNVAPALTITGAGMTNEGETYRLNLSSIDPGTDTITGWVIQWGDGTSTTITGSLASVDHVFLDGPNLFTISAMASDEDGTHSANTVGVMVNNLPPTLTISGAASVAETATYVLNLAAVLQGADPIGSWTITWGDGSVQTFAGNPASVTHVFADGPNDYSITATANDGDGNFSATSAVSVHVNNLPPTILNVVNNGPVVEGSPATITVTASDPAGAADPLRYEFDCNNDGTFEIGPQAGNSGSCTFGVEGNHVVQVRVTDGDAGEALASTTVVVNPTDAPILTALTNSSPGIGGAHQGEEVTISALFSDLNPLDTHSVLINWGDGSTSGGSITESNGSGTVAGGHIYVHGGFYTITVTLSDNYGGQDVETTAAVVSGVGLSPSGQLVIIGTEGREHIRIKLHNEGGSTQLRVRARFDLPTGGSDGGTDGGSDGGSDSLYTFNLNTVSSILVHLGDGDDRLRISQQITLSAIVDGGAGNDRIYTGGGNDTVVDLAGNNRIHSRGGNDTVTTGAGDDEVWTDGGNDSINVGGGHNEVHAGDGNDVVFAGAGNDRVWTDGGDDVINAGDGNNTINSGSGNDIVTTGVGRDVINAGAGDDRVRSGAGDDSVQGGAGNDILIGGDGEDLLIGGDGRDLLIGGFGADRLMGNADEDIVIAGYTSFDNNDSALSAIMQEWTSGNSNSTRIANIKAGTGLTAGNLLVGDDGETQTVFNDNQVDTLTGNQGVDWFFANRVADNGGVLDIVTDLAGNELWSDTDF